MAMISIQGNGAAQKTVSIDTGGEIHIGRSEGCDLPILDTKASRRHARVLAQGDAFLVEDLESTNGTLVNERPVTRKILEDGDVIRIGTTKLVFSKTAEAPVAPAKPSVSAPRVKLNRPAPRAAPKLDVPPPKPIPKFDRGPTKVIRTKLEAGRGRAKDAANGERKPRRKRR
jgi:pSer/pThr/pTyr-binding forkhead associated (FHA) protein